MRSVPLIRLLQKITNVQKIVASLVLLYTPGTDPYAEARGFQSAVDQLAAHFRGIERDLAEWRLVDQGLLDKKLAKADKLIAIMETCYKKVLATLRKLRKSID